MAKRAGGVVVAHLPFQAEGSGSTPTSALNVALDFNESLLTNPSLEETAQEVVRLWYVTKSNPGSDRVLIFQSAFMGKRGELWRDFVMMFRKLGYGEIQVHFPDLHPAHVGILYAAKRKWGHKQMKRREELPNKNHLYEKRGVIYAYAEQINSQKMIKIGFTGKPISDYLKYHPDRSPKLLGTMPGTLEEEQQIHRKFDGMAVLRKEHYPKCKIIVDWILNDSGMRLTPECETILEQW